MASTRRTVRRCGRADQLRTPRVDLSPRRPSRLLAGVSDRPLGADWIESGFLALRIARCLAADPVVKTTGPTPCMGSALLVESIGRERADQFRSHGCLAFACVGRRCAARDARPRCLVRFRVGLGGWYQSLASRACADPHLARRLAPMGDCWPSSRGDNRFDGGANDLGSSG